MTTHNSPDGTQNTDRKIKNYRYEDFQLEVSDKVVMELYLKIRFLEEESKFTEYEKATITRDTYMLAQENHIVALTYFERIINKTFDYEGSLSYILDRNKKLGL